MAFMKLSLFFIVFFCLSPLKASSLEEGDWEVNGAFFLKQRCYISLCDTSKQGDSTLKNSFMMVVDCQPYLYPLNKKFLQKKQKSLKDSNALRHFAFYNSFYLRHAEEINQLSQDTIHKLRKGEFCEANLLKEPYLRSVVVLALREHLEQEEGLAILFFSGMILDLLGGGGS